MTDDHADMELAEKAEQAALELREKMSQEEILRLVNERGRRYRAITAQGLQIHETPISEFPSDDQLEEYDEDSARSWNDYYAAWDALDLEHKNKHLAVMGPEAKVLLSPDARAVRGHG